MMLTGMTIGIKSWVPLNQQGIQKSQLTILQGLDETPPDL